MNKQELIERIEKMPYDNGILMDFVKLNRGWLLRTIEQLEPEKVIIPQFVAEIIEYYKGQNATLYDVLREKNFNKQYNEWLMNEQDAYNKVARAWLDGYEVEKEKRYIVRVKGVEEDNAFLNYYAPRNEWFMDSSCDMKDIRAFHTRKELEEAGFGWVFDCEGVEVEEVE